MAAARTFVEDFADGQGGFYGWVGNQEGPKPLEYLPAEDGGAVLSRSPWWIDYNHAPNPVGRGAGYLHIVYSYSTRGPIAELYAEVGGGQGGGEHTNSFVGHLHSIARWTEAKIISAMLEVHCSLTHTHTRARARAHTHTHTLLRLPLKALTGVGRRCLATTRRTSPTP
jgi:hypothetical protein